MKNHFTASYEERVIFALRELYADYGYSKYTMSKFEEYDLYVRNKDFLISDRVITFTDTNGKLMALKPDVTLSIIKSGKDEGSGLQKVYYNENVYRVAPGAHSFKEIMQVGLECIGDLDEFCIYEVLYLAAKSLLAISDGCVLDISHVGFLSSIFDGLKVGAEYREQMLRCIGEKNLHELMALCKEAGLSEEDGKRIKKLITLYGSPDEVLPKLFETFRDVADLSELEKLERLISLFDHETVKILRIDFSVINDIRYYNGIVFKGFVKDVPVGVLSGGQYDGLLKKMNRKAGALGFAVYLDALQRMYSKEEFDVDVLLLYGQNEELASIRDCAKKLMSQGMSVRVQKDAVNMLNYRKLMKVEEGRLILLEERA